MPALSRMGRDGERGDIGHYRRSLLERLAIHYPGLGCDMDSNWFPYVAAGAITVAIVVICLAAIRLGV